MGICKHPKRRAGVARAARDIVSLRTVIWWKEPVKSKSEKIEQTLEISFVKMSLQSIDPSG